MDMAKQRVEEEFRKKFQNEFRRCAPGRSLHWTFKGISLKDSARTGEGVVTQIDRGRGLIELTVSPELLAFALGDRPVLINGVPGRVTEVGRDYLDVGFPPAFFDSQLVSLAKDSPVEVRLDPVVQITYKPTSLKDIYDETLWSHWIVQTPVGPSGPGPGYYGEQVNGRKDRTSLPATFTVSGKAVDANGNMEVIYFNDRQPKLAVTVSLPESAISVLYRVGSFEGNFVRAMLMILVQLMFVAALAVFAGTFLGFAVASLLVFAILPFGLRRAGWSRLFRACPTTCWA